MSEHNFKVGNKVTIRQGRGFCLGVVKDIVGDSIGITYTKSDGTPRHVSRHYTLVALGDTRPTK